MAGFWWGNLKERDNLEDLGVDGTLKWTLKFHDCSLWIGLLWLRKGTICGLFWAQWWTL